MPLTPEQRKLAEENRWLVYKVIKERVINPNGIGIFTYEDLFQIGCFGLCKASGTYNPDSQVQFRTYAYMIIRNEIFKQLEYATVRRKREQLLAPDDATFSSTDHFTMAARQTELETLLDKVESETTGVVSKGIAAIRMTAQGYSCKEIGEQFGGASANNVSAWISRARKYLQQIPAIAAMAP